MKEGSFDGQMNDLDFSDNWTEGWKTKKTALPTELPKKLDLSQVPTNILRSSVVEALVSQNEDLMSRLGVTLRRIATLEEKLTDTRLESEQFRAKYENLNDQLLVLKEKSRALAERKDRDENEYHSLKEQIRMLEIRYAELYSTSEAKEANLLRQFSAKEKTLSRLTRYRARVSRAVASLKKAAKEKWEAELKLAQSELAQENLRKHLAESANYITELTRDHKQAMSALTDQHEHQLAQMQETIRQAQNNNETLAQRVRDYDQLVEDKLRLENEIVLRERREEELRIQTSTEISDLQRSLARYRNEAKDFAVKLEQTSEDLTQTKEQLRDSEAAQKALTEQVENLQILWRENQAQIEKTNEKNRSLQKLNQELSIAINQYRREIRELKEKLDTQSLQFIEKESLSATAKQVANSTPSPTSNATPELLQKIDEVFVEIHTNSKII